MTAIPSIQCFDYGSATAPLAPCRKPAFSFGTHRVMWGRKVLTYAASALVAALADPRTDTFRCAVVDFSTEAHVYPCAAMTWRPSSPRSRSGRVRTSRR